MCRVIWWNSLGIRHFRTVGSIEEAMEKYVYKGYVCGVQVYDEYGALAIDVPFVDPFEVK